MTTSSEIQRKLAEQLGKKEEPVLGKAFQESKSEEQTFPEPVFPEHDNTKKLFRFVCSKVQHRMLTRVISSHEQRQRCSYSHSRTVGNLCAQAHQAVVRLS